MDEVDEVCAFCHLRGGRYTTKSKAKGDPLICSVCRQEWQPQLVARTKDGQVLAIRPRPITVSKDVDYEMCAHGKCHDAKCPFAHSWPELSYWFQMRAKEEPRSRHPTGRLPPYRLCNHRAYCSHGMQCKFPHSEMEKRNWEENARKSTHHDSASFIRKRPNLSGHKLCRNISDCHFGNKCKYAHSKDELDAWNRQLRESEQSSSPKRLSSDAQSRIMSKVPVNHQSPRHPSGFIFTQEECSTGFKKAVTDRATVRLCIVKVMTVGPARVGKTWLRNLLLGQAQTQSHSTPVLGTTLTVSMFKDKRKVISDTVSASNAGWTVIDAPNHITAYLRVLQNGEYKIGQPYKVDKNDRQMAQPHACSLKEMENKSSIVKSDGQSTVKLVHAQPQPIVTQEQMYAKQSVASCLYDAIRTGDFKQEHVNLCNSRLLQFMDTGGQLAYHDILPVFITTPAVYLRVFNLSQPLGDHPQDTIELEDGKCLESGASPLSTLEMVSRSMLTVHTFANKKMRLPCLVNEQHYPRSRMLLVGTHLDKLEEEQRVGKENMEERLKRISRELSMVIPRRLHMVQCLLDDESSAMFFPVNNLLHQPDTTSRSALKAAMDSSQSAGVNQALAQQVQFEKDNIQITRCNTSAEISLCTSQLHGETNQQTKATSGRGMQCSTDHSCCKTSQLKWVQQLKDEVENVAKQVELDIPVKWYLHQLAISSQNEKPFRVYGELLQFCLDNQVVESASEFHDMVTLFHSLGLLVHHDVGNEPHEAEKHGEDSKCLIFTNPSFLYQKISTMYIVQFQQQTDRDMRDLKDTGIFSEGAFMQLELHENLECNWFMDLLQCLHIGAEVPHDNGRAIFVPSVLTASQTFFSDDDDEDLHTFVITFQSRGVVQMNPPIHYIPSGVFTSAVVHLLQSAEGKWIPVWDCISRLTMTFKINGTDYAQLSDCTTYIKVQICAEDDTMTHCYRDALLTAVSSAYKHLFHSEADLILGLPCPKEAAHIAELIVPAAFRFKGVGHLKVQCEQCHSGKPIRKVSSDQCQVVTSHMRRKGLMSMSRELQGREAEIFLKLNHEAIHHLQHTFDKKSLIHEPLTDGTLKEDTMSQRVTDHPNHLQLLRLHVSRAAAGKGRAVLEGVGLDSDTIEGCFQDRPLMVEEAVQMGLCKWKDGQGQPTWKALVDAMNYAQIADKHVTELKRKLGVH